MDENIFIELIQFGVPLGFASYLLLSLFSYGVRECFKLFEHMTK